MSPLRYAAVLLGTVALAFGIARAAADAGAPASVAVDAGVTLVDVITAAEDVKKAADDAKKTGDRTQLYLEIAAGAAVGLRYIIELLKNLMVPNSSQEWIPVTMLGLGVIVAILTRYAGGETWINAIILGGAAPGAVFAHEFLDDLTAWLKKHRATPATEVLK